LAAYSFTLTLLTSGGSVTGPTVVSGDTITLTVALSGNTGDATPSNPSGCVAYTVPLNTATPGAITTFSGSSYSVTYSYTDANTTVYSRTITGTVSGTPPTDTTPDVFTFTDVTNAALSTLQTSNLITISGMSTGASATVTVSGGTYSKNGGAYTSSAGTAVNGDTFRVQHTSSANFITATNTTLTVGGVSDTFTSTTQDFAGATYYVDANVEDESEPGIAFLILTIGGTGVGNPKLLNAGDRVGFRYVSNPGGATVSASLFDATHWTDTSLLTLTTSYQYKYAKAGIPVDIVDSVNVAASKSGYSTDTVTTSFMGASLQPDRSISLDESTYEISGTATSHTITISETAPNTNSAITEYRVRDSVTTHESRTGPGSLTITDVPSNDGFPKTYTIEARITIANGGSGLFSFVTFYDVIATTAATPNDPTISNYGFAIYDHNGIAITSFDGGHSTLRELFVSSVTTLSNTGTTDINTGLSGITTSNCVIMVEGISASGAESAIEVSATFVGTSPVYVRLARVVLSGQSVKVTVSQYSGDTIGAPDSYGFQIFNGNSTTVIDENSVVYGVKEIIALNPALSTQTLYQNAETYFLYVELTQGTYPASGGLPIPAISSSKSVYLMPPTLLGQKHLDGSYKTVLCYIPAGGAISGNYNLAMLVSSDNATPSYFGGVASSYGTRIFNGAGSLIWDSGWRQAIVNNIIPANQFTLGVTQLGTYDVSTGFDGVVGSSIGGSVPYPDVPYGMQSYSQVKSITGLNDMDPANTYLAGSSLSGYVSYYAGFWRDGESNTEGYAGGGRHRPGIRINSFNSADITMYRFSGGSQPPTDDEAADRDPKSYHPEGSYILFRVV